MLEWLIDNRQWLFSGAGIAIIAFIVPYILRLFRGKQDEPQIPQSGATISDSESTNGAALAIDNTGSGAEIKNTRVKGDLVAKSNPNLDEKSPKA